MFQRAALCARKYSHIEQVAHEADIAFVIFQPKRIFEIFPHHNNSATGAT